MAVHIAYHMGFRKVILLGIDGGSGHFHGDHVPPPAEGAPDDDVAECLRLAVDKFHSEGRELVTLSKHSKYPVPLMEYNG